MSKAQSTVLGTPSSGNIFADLGFENADEMLVRATLINKIGEVIALRCLSNGEFAELLRLPRSAIDDLLNGRDGIFNLEMLFRMLNYLGVDVDITVSVSGKKAGETWASDLDMPEFDLDHHDMQRDPDESDDDHEAR